jgi:hypothetical protein
MCTAVAFKEVIGVKKWASLLEEIVVDRVVDVIYTVRGEKIYSVYMFVYRKFTTAFIEK